MTEGGLTHSTGDRSEGGHPLNVIGVAAAESIALGVLSPLQDKLLSLVGGVLITHPAEGAKKSSESSPSHQRCIKTADVWIKCVYSRSTLHSEGTHGLEAKLHHVAALRGELMAAALEALLIEDNDLTRGKCTCTSSAAQFKGMKLFFLYP